MKIIFNCNEYPPSRSGGIGTVTKLIAEDLAARGHNITIVGLYDYYYPYKKNEKRPLKNEINGVTIFNYSYFSFQKYLGKNVSNVFRRVLRGCLVEHILLVLVLRRFEKFIQKIANEIDADIIELTDYNSIVKLLKYPVRFTKFKQITTIRVHGSSSFIEFYKNGSIKPTVYINDVNYFSRVDYILSTSNFSTHFIQTILKIKKEVVKIYNPVKINFENTTSVNLSSKSILYFGKLTKTKGFFSLISAFNELSVKYPEYYLTIIGSGDQGQINNFVTYETRRKINFLGFVNDEKLVEEIDNAYFCVLPSYFENFSMAALEVLARKRTLIYTKRASGSELITEGENGLLVDPDNIPEIIEKMELLINNPEVNQKLSSRGFISCSENYSMDVIIQKLENFYASCLKK